jgi:hypothetical protein
MTITNITKYASLEDGKVFCVDLDMQTYFSQFRIQTINVQDGGAKMSAPIQNAQNPMMNFGRGMTDAGKTNVLESYVAGLLDQVYKDKNKYKVEILRPNDTTILLKISDIQSKEVFFNKIDITNAISDTSQCKDEKTDSRIREYVTLQKYCKGSNFYKLQFMISGSDHTKITSKKIPFAKIQEAKDQKTFAEYINILHSSGHNHISNSELVNPLHVGAPGAAEPFEVLDARGEAVPQQAIIFYNSVPYNYYGGVYGGLYGLGLYGAGLYSYPRLGCGAAGCVGGVYGYPYGYSGVYGLPYVYTSPYVNSIVPTAPYLSAGYGGYGYGLGSPVVSSPIYSTVTPLTYNYPVVTNSNYTLGSYYSPYMGYGYSYASPFQYTYISPYQYVKSEEKRIKIEKDDVLPSQANTLGELKSILSDFHTHTNVERVTNSLIKVEVEKNHLKKIHYYTFEDGKLYLTNSQYDELLV